MADQRETDADAGHEYRRAACRLALASFFLRLVAALLLERDFPALPEGLDILVARDQSRLAGRDLPGACLTNRPASCAARLPNCHLNHDVPDGR